MLKLKEDGYVFVSDRGIEYELLEGMSIGSEQKYTSDIIFIMLNNAEYNVDNNVVGYLFGADIFLEDSRYYEESIKEMVDEFENRNFGKWGWVIMVYAKNDKVKIRDGRIGVIENVCYEMIDSEETDNIYCYEVNVDGISGYIVYPDEIAEKLWNDESIGK